MYPPLIEFLEALVAYLLFWGLLIVASIVFGVVFYLLSQAAI